MYFHVAAKLHRKPTGPQVAAQDALINFRVLAAGLEQRQLISVGPSSRLAHQSGLTTSMPNPAILALLSPPQDSTPMLGVMSLNRPGTDHADDKGVVPHGLSAHILPSSATMIGVCMTVLSIGHLSSRGEFRMVLDKLLAADAIVFLVSASLSFLSMRSRELGGRYETLAEAVFIGALGLLALVAVVFAFAVT